jgi:predicted Zn-dependent protease
MSVQRAAGEANVTIRRTSWFAAIAATAAVSACATAPPLAQQQCASADAQLAAVLQPLERLRASGCAAAGLECDRLQQQIARLAIVCPGHPPTLMANAIIAFDNHQPQVAEQFLDQLFAQGRPNPDAAVLRARIAIDAGNVTFAKRLLAQQLQAVPDHASLREAYAATLYLGGQMSEAETQLRMAAALGAPSWRVEYHLGLIDEAAGQLESARRHFTQALEANPDWQPARSHLNALRAGPGGAAGAP